MRHDHTSRIRDVRREDLDRILQILNHYIEHTAINFHTAALTFDQVESQWLTASGSFPWLVSLDRDGSAAGVAYAYQWKPRGAYAHTCETAVYVDPAHLRRGHGRDLYSELLPRLARLSYHSVIAGITLPNPASVALHESVGFDHVGALREVGLKFGRWHDVGYWQLFLSPRGPSTVS